MLSEQAPESGTGKTDAGKGQKGGQEQGAHDGADERRHDGAFAFHSIAQIREICDRVLWLEHGRMRMLGDTQEVCDAYMNAQA